MIMNTLRFGEIEIDGQKIVRFQAGLPGLEKHRSFAILQFPESYPIRWLQSVEDPGICLPVVDSFSVVPDYAFDIGDEDVAELKLQGPEDLYVLSVVVIPEQNIEQMTVNLVAPILVNIKTGSAKQIILTGGEYNVRFPIFRAVCNLIKEDESDARIVPENK